MTLRHYFCVLAAGLTTVAIPYAAHATERSLAIIENNAVRRIAVEQEGVRLVGRGQGTPLICVAVGQAHYWAKPEIWMTGVAELHAHGPTPAGEVSGGGNGIGSLRDLPAIAPGAC